MQGNQDTARPDMSSTSYQQLDELCQKHPAMFDLLTSPPGDKVEAFLSELHKTAYVRGLFEFGQLKAALKRLESLAPPTLEPPTLTSEERQAFDHLREQKRFEREVRFIHRVAKIIGPCDQQIEILAESAQRRKRTDAEKSLSKAFKDLSAVLEDEFFKEKVKSSSTLMRLLRLRDELEQAPEWIAQTHPKYFKMSAQYPDYARTRQLVNRLADACYRFYAACDAKVIAHLTSYPCLVYTAEGNVGEEAMAEALERKVDQFNRRLPDEDNIEVSLRGEWIPALTLSPPWLAA